MQTARVAPDPETRPPAARILFCLALGLACSGVLPIGFDSQAQAQWRFWDGGDDEEAPGVSGRDGTAPGAGDYFVRASGDDSNDGLTLGTAFRSIGRAAEVAADGDLIYVGGGTYTGEILVEGIQGITSPVRFVADTRGNITGDGGAVIIQDSKLHVLNSNDVEFYGFTFQGTAARFVQWTGSYNGRLDSCNFANGDEGLLIENGSLTMENCSLSGFAHDGLQINGEALVTVERCTITGCGESGIEVSKLANVVVRESTIRNNVEDGIKVAVTAGDVIEPEPTCECTVSSPLALKQSALQLLRTVSPDDETYQQLLTVAGDLIEESVQATNWRDERHLVADRAAEVFGKSQDAIEVIDAVMREDVEFLIENGTIVVDHPFFADVTVVGAAISNGSQGVPVTVKVTVGDNVSQPWGSFDSPTGGDVNDGNNPRSHQGDVLFDASQTIRVAARSWLRKSWYYSGNYDSHFNQYLTVDSDSGSPNVRLLRDGDPVPTYQGYNGQASAETFLAPYIDSNDRITLEDNQAIFLFELGTTNLGSSAADFQDLVVVITMRRPGATELTADQLAALRTVIERLVESDQLLAECAINEASCLGGTDEQLAAATEAYNNGAGSRNEEAWQESAERFEVAWVAAHGVANTSDTSFPSSVASIPVGWTDISRGTLTVLGTTLQTNAFGLKLETEQDYTIDDCVIGGNGWGVYQAHAATLDDCQIEDNTIGGIWLVGVDSDDLQVNDLTLSDNVEYGLYAESSEVTLTAGTLSDLNISGSQYVIASSNSDVTVDGATISGGSIAAIYATGGTLTVSDATISNSGYGVAGNLATVHVEGSNLSDNSVGIYTLHGDVFVENCSLTGNTTWAASVTPSSDQDEEVRFDNVTVNGNTGGIAVIGAEDGHFELVNSTIRDNSNTGLHFESCTLTIDDQSTAGWHSLRNLHGISSDRSTLSLIGVTLSDSGSYALHSVSSDITLRGSNLNGESGVFARNNSNLTIDASVLTATSGGTKGVHREGGAVSVTNTVINGFESGLYLTSGDLSGTIQIRQSTVIAAGGTGFHLASGNATLSNTILAGSGTYGIRVAGGTLTHSHNLLHGFSTPYSGTSASTGEVVKDPRFVDLAAGNLQLNVGSPAINAGKDLTGVVSVDLAGASRPTHHAYEIGAYEFTQDQGSFRVLEWSERQ